MSRSKLIAAGLGAAAVGGYGAAMGRDAWRTTRKNAGFFLVLAAAAAAATLPFIGARDFGRQGRITGGGIFRILGGYLLGLVLVFAALILADSNNPLLHLIVWPLAVTAIAAFIGFQAGKAQRPLLERQFEIETHNESFLEEQGIEETGGSDITHIDGDGNSLRFLEAHAGRLVFMAVGKRNKRAFITLDDEGRMLEYSGVVSL